MPPTACVEVGALPLQLLLRRHPDWSGQPVAVVTEDQPLGTVAAVNRAARAAGVRVGMRYAAALSLVAHLHAATITPEQIAAEVETVRELLLAISPRVEWAGDAAGDLVVHQIVGDAAGAAAIAAPWLGVFWIEVAGLQRHYRSAAALAVTLLQRLRAARFRATVALGYTRIGTCILAQQLHRQDTRRCWLVAPDLAAEQAAARRAPLEMLPLDPPLRDLLEKLDIVTVAHFLRLPYGQLLSRFGPRVAAVHRAAAGSGLELPVQSRAPAPRFLRRRRLEQRETDAARLLAHCAALLDQLLAHLQERGRAVLELELRLLLEDGGRRRESIRPAAPTLHRQRLIELLGLRLRALNLTAGVEELALELREAPVPAAQGALFVARQRRDPAAAAEALARIRAEFGNQAVLRAVLLEAHLPETQFRWQPAGERWPLPAAAAPEPRGRERPPALLVRRILDQPLPLAAPRSAPGVRRLQRGPFLISSGWWRAAPGTNRPSDRAYYFLSQQGHSVTDKTMNSDAQASPADGALEWIYYDRLTGRWYLQGWVE